MITHSCKSICCCVPRLLGTLFCKVLTCGNSLTKMRVTIKTLQQEKFQVELDAGESVSLRCICDVS